MTLTQLRYLVLLAEERSFTRAAARGNVAQPALSRQIRKLEEELAVPLVDRTTRRVALTADGERLVERARRVLDELRAARDELGSAAAVLTGRVEVGLTPTPGPLDAPRLLARFHRRHPGIELTLREELSVDLAERLRRDELDLAFVSGIGGAVAARLELRRLAAEPLVAIVPAGHRLARAGAVSLPDLRDERFVAFPPGATIRDAVARAAARAGVELRMAFESNEIARLRALVAHGLGIGVLPESDSRAPGPEVVPVALADPELVYEVNVAWRAGRRLGPAAARLLDDVLSGADPPA